MKAYRVSIPGKELGIVEPKPHETLQQAIARRWPTYSASPRLVLEPMSEVRETWGGRDKFEGRG